MKLNTSYLDQSAIGLSLLCAAHCLLLPLLVVLVPSLAASAFAGESFHQWLVFAVVPTSLLALTLGCRQHRQKTVLVWGLSGLFFICLALVAGHDLLGDNGEKAVTLLGAALIAWGHYRNFQLCQKPQCGCNAKAD